MPRELTEADVNPDLLRMNPEFVKGALAIANMINSNYAERDPHPYLIGDCAMAKLNLLKRGKSIRSRGRVFKRHAKS